MTVAASSGYGLDKWREEYGSARTITSAYRNPVRNDAVGGAQASRHLFGDAADLRNESGALPEWNDMETAAHLANADYVAPQTESGLGHVHADWRNHNPGDYAQ